MWISNNKVVRVLCSCWNAEKKNHQNEDLYICITLKDYEIELGRDREMRGLGGEFKNRVCWNDDGGMIEWLILGVVASQRLLIVFSCGSQSSYWEDATFAYGSFIIQDVHLLTTFIARWEDTSNHLIWERWQFSHLTSCVQKLANSAWTNALTR